VIPNENKSYGTKGYWESRYQKEPECFDWFKGYSELKHVLAKYVKPQDSILMIGCGNATLSEDMYNDSFQNITNIDFSEEVIRIMENRCKNLTKMKWMVMDVMDLQFSKSHFDIVIDKGTMDALLCDQESAWEVEESLAINIDKMLSEINRVLTDNGVYIYITFGQPHFRKPLIQKEKYQWDLHVETIGEFFHYFIYIVTKRLNPK